MQSLTIKTGKRAEFIDVTDIVRRAVAEAGVADGVCHVFVPHTTAGITINESADPDVQRDILGALERFAPRGAGYLHSEGNANSHIKASLMGSSVAVPVESGRLVLGTWQAIYFCEFDGPRTRSLIVKVLKG